MNIFKNGKKKGGERKLLRTINLSKSFNKEMDNEINLFNNFNLEIEKNKCTAIIGPNGCGKSTY